MCLAPGLWPSLKSLPPLRASQYKSLPDRCLLPLSIYFASKVDKHFYSHKSLIVTEQLTLSAASWHIFFKETVNLTTFKQHCQISSNLALECADVQEFHTVGLGMNAKLDF